MIRRLLLVSVLVSVTLTLRAAPALLTARDVDGRVWTPFAPATGDTHVLIFIASDCPISSRYAPEIDRIAAEYRDRHVQTFLIYADASIDAARVKTHLREFHPALKAPAIIDAALRLADAGGITVTPEALVVAATGRAYRGRIDDLYVNAGQMRRAPLHHDLREALEAVLKRQPLVEPVTPAVGCYIEREGRK